MKFKLSQDPHQWRTFMLQVSVLLILLDCLLAWRGAISGARCLQLQLGILTMAIAAWVRPRWFRGFYRIGMVVSAWLGDKVGRMVLALMFVVIFLPLGLGLRLAGYDPLALRKPRGAASYWRAARKPGRLEQMF